MINWHLLFVDYKFCTIAILPTLLFFLHVKMKRGGGGVQNQSIKFQKFSTLGAKHGGAPNAFDHLILQRVQY